MPAPIRGSAVLHTGTVTADFGVLLAVDIAGETYQLPWSVSVPVGGSCWVLFAGRSGVVLGEA